MSPQKKLFRRHTASCPHKKKGRAYSLCACQLWEDTHDADGKRVVRSLKTAGKGGTVISPKPRRCAPEPRKPLTEAEIEAILATTDTLRQKSSRREARAAILLLRDTGMRIGDVALLKKSQVEVEGCRLSHIARKNRKPIQLPLTAETVSALLQLDCLIMQDASGRFFGGLVETLGGGLPGEGGEFFFHRHRNTKAATTISRLCRLLRLVFRRSGVERAHPHLFRATLASNLASRGVDIRIIASILGDTPRTVEKHYIRLTPKYQQQIDEAMGFVVTGRNHMQTSSS